jgi:hypothetical protein
MHISAFDLNLVPLRNLDFSKETMRHGKCATTSHDNTMQAASFRKRPFLCAKVGCAPLFLHDDNMPLPMPNFLML